MSATRRFTAIAILALVLLAPALTGCGKKDAPTPPPGVPDTYPRPYPRE
jgi:predicted small lipoprotein YifL